MDEELNSPNDELTDLLGKLVGRLEESSISVHVLAALLEEKGLLTAGELDDAVNGFLRERGQEYLIEQWGRELGGGLYEGLALKDLQ
jgi:hypothetical protein